MWAYWRITPALPLKEFNGSFLITTGSGHMLDNVRLHKLGMFLVIHGNDLPGRGRTLAGLPTPICVIYLLPNQIEFVILIINHLTEHGVMKPE